MTLLRPTHLALAAAFVLAGCTDTTVPSVTPVEAAGIYTLTSVSGRGPASGTFTLTADQRVERRVRYANDPAEVVFVGSFSLDATGIAFTLIPGDRPATYVWPVRGEWRGSELTISYPDPADGPDIVEHYRRP